jgi:NTE family protein
VSPAVYVDGLIFSNLPVDAAREAGRVVVVDITSPYPTGQRFDHGAKVLGGMVDTMITQNTQRQLALLGPQDLLLKPEVSFIGDLDYGRQDEARPVGRQALLARAEDLKELQLSPEAYAAWFEGRRAKARRGAARLGALRVALGADPALLEGLRQREGEPIDFAALEAGLERLLGTGLYEDVDFRLSPSEGSGRAEAGYLDLTLYPRLKPQGLHVLDMGLKLVADLEGRSEFELLLQITNRTPQGRQWRHQVFVGRVNGLGTELTQPLVGAVFVAPHGQLQDRLAQLPGNGPIQVQRASGGVDLGAWLWRAAELRAGWTASRLWSPQWGGYSGGVESAGWQALLTVDTLDDPHFPSRGTYLRAQAFDARGALHGPSAYDVGRLGLHQAFSVGRLVLLLGGELQHSFGTALPFYEQGQLGGFLRLGGYRPGRFSGDELWLGRVLLGWRHPQPGDLIAKAILYGISVEAGEAGSLPWQPGGSEAYSAAAYVGLDTLIGPFYLAHARDPEGAGVSYVYLGNPF